MYITITNRFLRVQAGGVEVVAEVLCDEASPEEERSEAAGVLAQVTSPWVEDNHRLAGLHDNMDAIVAALTGIDVAQGTHLTLQRFFSYCYAG